MHIDELRQIKVNYKGSLNLPIEQAIFNQARGFHDAAIRCTEAIPRAGEGVIAVDVPMAVNYAFAAELYLKSLRLMQAGGQARGHELNTLFNGLPSKLRGRLKARWLELVPVKSEVLENPLRVFSDVFRAWRYVYEVSDGLQVNAGDLVAFVQALYTVAREERPDWAVDDAEDARLRRPPATYIFALISSGEGSFGKMEIVVGQPAA